MPSSYARPCFALRLAARPRIRSQADEDDAELSESQTAEGQSSESERESEHEEPPAEKPVQARAKKSKGQSKSAIVKATEVPTRARAVGKSPIGVPESLNPDRLFATDDLQESDAAQRRTAPLAEIQAENATQTNRIESYIAANEGLFQELLRDNEEARLGFSVLKENVQRKLRVADEPHAVGGRLR